MAPLEAGQAFVELVPRLDPAFAAKAGAQVEEALTPVMDRVAARLDNVGEKLRGIGLKLSTFVTLPIIGAGLAAFHFASDLNESITKAQVVFGDYFAQIDAWSSTAAKSLGISRQEALESAGTFGNLFRAMGIGLPVAAEMSQKVVGLASDLASFNNANPQDVLEALRAGLVGEAEPLRRFGVNLSAARVEALGMQQGINKAYNEMTPAEKATLSYQIILEDTTLAQGDFARTSSGAANQTRINTARIKDLAANIGSKLLPIGQRLLEWIGKAFDYFDRLSPTIKDVALGVLLAAAAVGPLTYLLGGLATVLGFIAANPIVLVLAAIAAAAFLLYKNWDKVWPEIQRVAQEVFDWLEEHAGFLVDAVEGIIAGVLYVRDHWREIWRDVRRAAMDAWRWIEENIGPVFTRIAKVVEVAFDRISDVVDGAIAVILFLWDHFGRYIIEYLQTAWDTVVGIVEGVLEQLRGVLDIFIGIFTLDWDTFWSGIKEFFGGIWDTIVAIVGGALSLVWTQIKAGLDFIGYLFGLAWGGIRDAVAGVWNELYAIVSGGIETVVGFVASLPGRLLNLVGTVLGAAASLGRAIIDGIGDGISAAGDALASIGEAVFDAFKRGWNSVADFINGKIPNEIGFDTPFGFVGVDLPDNPIPTFHRGGIVPGRRGEEVLALLEAGEKITPAGETDSGGPKVQDNRVIGPFYVTKERDILDELAWQDATRGTG